MPPVTVQQAFALALQHHQAGRLAEAEGLYRQILAVQPNYADALHFLGVIAHQVGRHDVAVQLIPQAIALDPNNPASHSNLGEAYRSLGRLDEAVACYRRTLQLKPDDSKAHNNLGIALAAQGRRDEAVASFRCALQLQADQPEFHNNLGNALRQIGQLDEAVAAYRGALKLNPEFADAERNLGNALVDQGRLDEAIASYRRARDLRPDQAVGHDSLIFALHFLPGADESIILEEQRRWNRQIGEPLQRFVVPHSNDRNPERRVRIGYVSPGFGEHVVGRNIMPLFKCHDSGQFEILCYADVISPDNLTDEFRRHAAQWRSTVGMGDEELAAMIRQDNVDILVDLAQHTEGNRLPVFARRPAPVQVSFAGYPDSTGLEAIKYRISDRFLEERRMRSVEWGMAEAPDQERVLLIDSFWCYDPCGMEVPVNASPAGASGRVTFGSLNNFCKVNDQVLNLWARVLGATENSQLILLSGVGSHRQRALQFLADRGVASQRVEFVERSPRREYLELHHRLDIALDPFPYNGHTTSLDALWMGVPVVSLAGQQAVSRAGLSQLSNVGLPELVAFSEDDYIAIATQLAHNLPRLAELRTTLRQRMEVSVLMDAPRFTRQIEDAYRAMWRQWCAQETVQ